MQNKKPRILFYDIETAYEVARLWRSGEQFISHEQLIPNRPTGIICIAWKWAGESKIHSMDWGLKKQNNDKMIETFSKIVESADVTIGHNANNFDSKHLNTQRLLAGKSPINWGQKEDTLLQFRKHFKLSSNKLDYLGQVLLGQKKHPMSFVDWVNVIELKCPKAMAKMLKYCKKDVALLEAVYNKGKPFFDVKANRSILLHNRKDGCPSCASLNIRSDGLRTTQTTQYRRERCNDCGHCFKGPVVRLP